MASRTPPLALWRGMAAGIVLALLLGAWLAPAQAGDDDRKAFQAQVTEHSRRLADYKKQRDVHGLYDEIWRAPTLYREAKDLSAYAALQARLVHGIGPLCKHKDERIRRCAVEALGVMKNDEGARYLKPLLKDVRKPPVDPVAMAAIESSGGVCHESLVEPLLKIVQECPCPRAAGKAVEALGHFGKIKNKREKILIVVLESTLAEENLKRWKGLADAAPASLNRLTGRKVASLQDWLELVDNNRQDLSVLFEKEEVVKEEPAGA